MVLWTKNRIYNEIFAGLISYALCFSPYKLLKEAYIRARYDKKYKITEEELLYLTKRVEKLKDVTEKICLA